MHKSETLIKNISYLLTSIRSSFWPRHFSPVSAVLPRWLLSSCCGLCRCLALHLLDSSWHSLAHTHLPVLTGFLGFIFGFVQTFSSHFWTFILSRMISWPGSRGCQNSVSVSLLMPFSSNLSSLLQMNFFTSCLDSLLSTRPLRLQQLLFDVLFRLLASELLSWMPALTLLPFLDSHSSQSSYRVPCQFVPWMGRCQ